MASAGAQYATIGCGENISNAVRIGARAVSVALVASFGVTSQTLTAQAALIPGGGTASAAFIPVLKSDLTGAWSHVMNGPFAVSLTPHFAGFDEVRFLVSSVQNSVRTLSLITKI
jgi:hypothetical protein